VHISCELHLITALILSDRYLAWVSVRIHPFFVPSLDVSEMSRTSFISVRLDVASSRA
jgi:hypothetical protein